MPRVQRTGLLTFLVNYNGLCSRSVLLGLHDIRLSLDIKLQSGGIPVYIEALLLARSICRLILRISEIWQRIGPVREMQGKIFITLLLNIANFVAVFDNQIFYPKDF